MFKISFYRLWQTTKLCLKDHFCLYKKWYMVFLSLAVVALIIGFIAGIRIATSTDISKISDSILLNYLEGDISIFGVFFSRLFSLIGLFILIWATNCKPFLSFLSVIVIIYKSFTLGSTCSVLIAIFNVSGVINVIFLVFPCQLLFLLLLIGWASVCMSYNFSCKQYGGSIFSQEFFCKERVTFSVFLGILFIVTLIEAILMPWLSAILVIS